MRKFTVAIVALFAIVAFTSASYAANAVQVTLTSPTITKTGCEKAGAVTFGFEAGSTIVVGDYWYMDLPTGVTFCKAIDYIIVGDELIRAAASTLSAQCTAGNTKVLTSASSTSKAWFVGGLSIGNVGAIIATPNYGPITGICESGTPAWAAKSTGNIALRVKAAANQRRIYLYAIGGTSPAVGTLAVQTGHRMNVKILDGSEWNTNAGTLGSNTYIITNKYILTTAANQLTYGENGTTTATNELIDPDFATANDSEPAVENTLCLNATGYGSDTVNVSFASKSDKHTFTGDAQIAHSGASASITLAACKGLTEGDIIIGSQNTCSFVYDTATSYCTGTGKFAGNKIDIKSTSDFGDPADVYDVVVTSTTAGTYFNAAGTVSKILATVSDACATGVTTTAAGTLAMYVGSTAFTGTPGTTCSVASSSRVNVIKTTGGAITGLNGYNILRLGLPTMVYDTTLVGVGTKATIQVSLEKYPCGEMFTGQLTLGTYIAATSCTSASSSSTTLRFPFLIGFDGGSTPWWSGFVITNHSSAAGTIVLTLTDVNGNIATYTTPSIAAGKQFNSSTITVANLTQSTSDAGGDFGSGQYSIVATCNFGSARGFVFMGNGNEGTGYVVND